MKNKLTKSTGGRPVKFSDVQTMQKRINVYFKSAKIPTIQGLCLHLDICRETLHDYEINKPAFSDTIKRAKQQIEKSIAEGALEGVYNSTFSIFYLKNAFGWSDRQEVSHSGAGFVFNFLQGGALKNE